MPWQLDILFIYQSSINCIIHSCSKNEPMVLWLTYKCGCFTPMYPNHWVFALYCFVLFLHHPNQVMTIPCCKRFCFWPFAVISYNKTNPLVLHGAHLQTTTHHSRHAHCFNLWNRKMLPWNALKWQNNRNSDISTSRYLYHKYIRMSNCILLFAITLNVKYLGLL
jgi:hypothetical protein